MTENHGRAAQNSGPLGSDLDLIGIGQIGLPAPLSDAEEQAAAEEEALGVANEAPAGTYVNLVRHFGTSGQAWVSRVNRGV